MLLTLHTNAVRSLVRPVKGEPSVDLIDLPRFAREELGLYGLNLTTDLLAGAVRSRLEKIREAADKSGCACLLLIEQDALALADEDDERALAGLERIDRVIRAAQILGCNSIAFRVAGGTDDASLERVVEHLKEATERADRGEINMLIAPTEGLTAEPDRVTAIIKKVGGFRVGTFPDFEAASRTPDPVTYLRRLTPYAAAVCASTVEFVEVDMPGDEPAGPASPARDAAKAGSATDGPSGKRSKGKAAAKGAEADEPAPPPESGGEGEPKAKGRSKGKSGVKAAAAEDSKEPSAGKKSRGKASAPPPEPEPEDDDSEEEELKKLGAEMGLIDEEAWSEIESMLADIPPPPEHRPYALEPLVRAVVSVGYDGTLVIDYRGRGDPIAGILSSRAAIEAALRQAER